MFPNVPAVPGMPCQGEDRKFFLICHEILNVNNAIVGLFHIPGTRLENVHKYYSGRKWYKLCRFNADKRAHLFVVVADVWRS